MDIKTKDRTVLKSFFRKNSIPTETHFENLIDAMLNQKEDGLVKLPNDPLSIQAAGDANSQKKIINFYDDFADEKPAWMLSLNPRTDPNDADSGRAGFNISDGAGNSRLFIDRDTGQIVIRSNADEALIVNGRINAGNLLVGPWPKDPENYGFIGVNSLVQSQPQNYALLQAVSGRTYLNSPSDIRICINNQDQIVVDVEGNVSVENNLHIKKDLRVTGKIIGEISQKSWFQATLENGWKNYNTGHSEASYFKDSCGLIHLKGLVKDGLEEKDKPIFTLPEGYRPSRRAIFVTLTHDNITARINVDKNGKITHNGGKKGWLSLDGISFTIQTHTYPVVGHVDPIGSLSPAN